MLNCDTNWCIVSYYFTSNNKILFVMKTQPKTQLKKNLKRNKKIRKQQYQYDSAAKRTKNKQNV